VIRRRAAVLGHPISHSLSPVLHRAAYAALGLDWAYEAVDVTSGQLPEFLAGMDESWAGLSLTMPLKQTVLSLLASQSQTVAETGGANTVLVTPAGFAGHNTDVYGIVTALRRHPGFTPPRTVAIIGAGATAASALVAARQLGPRAVRVCARRPEAAADLVARAAPPGASVSAVPWERVADAFSADTVVCTLPGDAAEALTGAIPASAGLLLDVSYHPWPTTLAAAWQRAGGAVVAGHRMLLWQAARQVELMTGHPAPVSAMAEALDASLG
jgi:shikimate dehydrogenase